MKYSRKMRRKRRRVSILLCITLLFSWVQPVQAEDVQSDQLTVSPRLMLPSCSWEGHAVVFGDDSSYQIGREYQNLQDMYKDGKVKAEFTISDEEIRMQGVSGAYGQKMAVFPSPGNYTVEMTLHLYDGSTYTVQKSIRVERAPEVQSTLSGAQKQYRLQRLSVRCFQNPAYPLAELKLFVRQQQGEEAEVRLISDGKEDGSLNESSHIFLRNPKVSTDEDGENVWAEVEFLCAFSDTAQLEYEIRAVDGRGQMSQLNEAFTVKKDEAPAAVMNLSDSYLRNAESNEATITLEDVSSADGDTLTRQWYVKEQGETIFTPIENKAGFEDLSDGARSRVAFTKEGTGAFTVKLRVTDVWSEGTMEERDAGWPRLWAETEQSSRVTNTAPVVSLGIQPMKSADVVILTADRTESQCVSLEEAFRHRLLEMKADAHVQVAQLDPSRLGSGAEPVEERFTRKGDYGYNGSSTSFERGLYLVDDEALYCVDAVWSNPDSGWPEEPYTITCLDADTGQERWHYQLTSEIFGVNHSAAALYQDDTMKYLYLVSQGKTMVISKETGQPVAFFDTALGEQNFVDGSLIYTCRSDGISAVSLKDGSSRMVWTGSLSGCVRRMGGQLVTYTRNGSGTILKISVDPADGAVSEDFIGRLPSSLYLEDGKNTGGTPVLDVVGIDSQGRGILQIYTPLYNDSVRYSLSGYRTVIQVYDRDDSLVRQLVRSSSQPMKTVPVTDRAGRYHYAAISYSGDDSVSVEIAGIDQECSVKASASDSNGDPAEYSSVIYSIEEADGVYVTLGGYCTWIYNQTWGNGPSHGYPERCLSFRFDPLAGTGSKTSLMTGCVSFSEYSRSSNLYTVIHTGRNSQYAGTASLDNTVTKRTVSVDDMVDNIFGKYLRSQEGADYKILVVDGKSIYGKLDEGVLQRLVKTADDRGYRLFLTGVEEALDAFDYGSICSLGAESQWPDEVYDALSDAETPAYGRLDVTAGEGGGGLSRTFRLFADRKYYYELRSKTEEKEAPTLSVNHRLTDILDSSLYGESQWVVESSVSEDFDDEEPGRFFSFGNYSVSGGMFSDCTASRYASSNALAERSSLISFTVPEGKQGVLSFDYRIFNSSDQGRPNANYADIDGIRWEMPSGTSGSGNYTHPLILTPGEHSLMLHTGGYGGKILSYTYIDNLKVSWVSRVSPENGGRQEGIAIPQADGTFLITGSFETPGSASVYRAMKNVEYVEGQPGTAAYSTMIQTTDNSRKLLLEIPEGKTALSPSVVLKSRVFSQYNVSYDMGGYGSMTCYGTIKSPGSTLSAIPAEWQFCFPALRGSIGCTTSYSSYRGTSGSFDGVTMYVADDTNALVEEHRYLRSETESGEKTLFLGEKRYEGESTLQLRLPEGSTGLWDFSLYVIENGKRLYVCKEELTGDRTSSRWEKENVSVSSGLQSEESLQEVVVYRKGQLVDYNAEYWDYENDPSKESFWRYTFQPAEEAEDTFAQAAVVLDSAGNVLRETDQILSEPVTRFYSEGRYTVEHWQEDQTVRNGRGDAAEDKESNHVFLTFYIGGMEDAPWIRYIRTIPEELREGDSLTLEVGLDDAKGEELTLETELYLGDTLAGYSTMGGIVPGTEGYEPVLIRDLEESLLSGDYKVLCTVRDASGTGIGSYAFRVLCRGSVDGMVYHTEQWESHRQQAGRPELTFWPGERLMLRAVTEGSPDEVCAWIEGEPDACVLSETSDGVYTGSLWAEDMMYRWGKEPLEKTVVFRAVYGEEEKLSQTVVVFDNRQLYWNLYQKQGA